MRGSAGLVGAALRGPHVTDETLEQLRPHMERLTGFNRLELVETSVTDQGLKQLLNLTQLSYLDLSGTQVTAEGLRQLKGLRLTAIVPKHISDEKLSELATDLPDIEFRRHQYTVSN